MTTIQYLSLTKFERFLVKFGEFFRGIGKGFVNFFKAIPNKLLRLWHKICSPFVTLYDSFKKGSWGVRTNFLVMGFYQLTHHQIIRGVLYLVFEVVFIWFMISTKIRKLRLLRGSKLTIPWWPNRRTNTYYSRWRSFFLHSSIFHRHNVTHVNLCGPLVFLY